MGWHKIKRRPSDTAFSNYIRERDRWTCQYCGRVKCEWESGRCFHCAHIFSRKFESTRFYDDNAMCLCATCHKHFTDKSPRKDGHIYPPWQEWCEEKLGEKRWNLLLLYKNTPSKLFNKKEKDILVKRHFEIKLNNLINMRKNDEQKNRENETAY